MQVWILSRTLDLSLIMGGALFSLALAGLALTQESLVPFFFWAWVILLEGPHFAITWVRTFGDQRFVREHGTLLARSLFFFVIPLSALVLDQFTASAQISAAWGFFIFLWSLYHNTRQHYGFVALWSRRFGIQEDDLRMLRWGTYLVCYAFMAKLLFSFKLPGSYQQASALVPWMQLRSPSVVFALLGFVLLGIRFGKRALVPVSYLALVGAYYFTLFFVIAHTEPFLSTPLSSAEGFLMVTVLNSSFHNIQYLAISAWRAKRDNITQLPLKIAACFAFGVLVFLPIFWARGEVRFLETFLSDATLNQIAYVLYFGIVGQHFFLDQYIWRSKHRPV